MMQTGPIVTLQVAKFAASYHGLEALLRESTPEKTTGKHQYTQIKPFSITFYLLLPDKDLFLPHKGRETTLCQTIKPA